METIRDIFKTYGMDYEITMKRFGGNEALYLRILEMLPKDGSVERLGIAIRDNDMETAFEAAHTLKGVVGNLGLTSLFAAVCAIVEPLRVREVYCDYGQLYATVQTEYQKAKCFLKSLKEI